MLTFCGGFVEILNVGNLDVDAETGNCRHSDGGAVDQLHSGNTSGHESGNPETDRTGRRPVCSAHAQRGVQVPILPKVTCIS
jgi:hypothetical protein